MVLAALACHCVRALLLLPSAALKREHPGPWAVVLALVFAGLVLDTIALAKSNRSSGMPDVAVVAAESKSASLAVAQCRGPRAGRLVP